MYLGIFIVYGHYVVYVFCHKLPNEKIVWFWVCNVGKPWQNMIKTKSHWFRMVYIEVQDKKLKFGMKKMSYKLFHLIGTRSIENCISTKINKRKKPITWPFWSPNREPFFPVFKENYKLTLGGGFLERLECILCLFCRSRVLYPKAL